MISIVLMLSAAVLLVIALREARRSRSQQLRLERDNDNMQRELARHHETVQSILRELQG